MTPSYEKSPDSSDPYLTAQAATKPRFIISAEALRFCVRPREPHKTRLTQADGMVFSISIHTAEKLCQALW